MSDDELLSMARAKTAAVERETRTLEILILEARRRFDIPPATERSLST